VRTNLSLADLFLITGLVPLLALAELYLRFVSSQTVLQRFQNAPASRGSLPPAKGFLRAAQLLEKLDRRLFHSPACLRKTLVLVWMASLLRYPAQVKIGVRKHESGELGAHAWIEVGGLALETTPQDEFYLLTQS